MLLRSTQSTAWLNSSSLVRRLINLIRLAQPLLLSEEYPKLTVFSLHPGTVKTQMAEEASDSEGYTREMVYDTVHLPAATMLYLTSGRVDWLYGKSVRCFSLVMSVVIQNLTNFEILGGQLGYCGD